MDMISEAKEVKARKFAHIINDRVVNLFEWKEERNPDLGEQNLLLDITESEEEITIGDVYDGKSFKKPVMEEITKPTEEEKKPLKEELLDIIDELRKRIETL